MSSLYTITVKFAPKGTPYQDKKTGQMTTSLAGHVWLEGRKPGEINPSVSAGWSTGNSMFAGGENNLETEDWFRYRGNGISSIMVEVSKEQYDKLKKYPNLAANGEISGFDKEYNLLTNSCIDFSAKGLWYVGLAHSSFEGKWHTPDKQLDVFLLQIARNRAPGAALEVEHRGQKYQFQPDERDLKNIIKKMHLSLNIEEVNHQQYVQSPSLRLENLPEPVQKLYRSAEAHLAAYHEKNGLPLDEERLKNAAMSIAALGYSETMGMGHGNPPMLFNVKNGQYIFGERNPGLIRAEIDMDKALFTPLEESIGRVRQTEIRFQQEEMERQLAQSQSRGMSLS